jgi:aspartyl protease family protein
MPLRPTRQRHLRNRYIPGFPVQSLGLNKLDLQRAQQLGKHGLTLLRVVILQLRVSGSRQSLWRQTWLLILISCLLFVAPLPGMVSVATAQVNSAALGSRLDQAVRQQNWADAIKIIDQMIVAEPQRAGQLRAYRLQLLQLQQTGFRSPTPPAAATAPVTPNSGTLAAQVPILRRSGGVPVVNVTFNRSQTFEMLVDSGASMTVITRQMARSLGITEADVIDEIRFATANGNVVKPIVLVNVIEFGGLARTRVPVAIAPPGMEVGLLGQDFLGRFDVSIRRNVIEFHRRP